MRTVGVLRALHAFLVKPPTVFYRFLRFLRKTVTVIASLRLVLRKTVTVIDSLRLILRKTVTVIGSLRPRLAIFFDFLLIRGLGQRSFRIFYCRINQNLTKGRI